MPHTTGHPRPFQRPAGRPRVLNSTNSDILSVVSGGVPFYDLVWETANAPGTSNVTLLGAKSGGPFQPFSNVMQNGQLTFYRLGDTTGDYEIGFGIWLSVGPTLVRQQVIQSSNSDQLVNFTGSVDVIQPEPADWFNWVDSTVRSQTQQITTLQQQVTSNSNSPDPFLGDWRNLLIQNYPVSSGAGKTFSVFQMQFSPGPMASFFEVILNNGGQALKVQSSGFIIDYRTVGVNGGDGSAYPTNGWVYFWVISNGSNVGGLVSASATAPNLPSGYVWSALVGSYSTGGSPNNTFTTSFYQLGKTAYGINYAVVGPGAAAAGSSALTQVTSTTRISPIATKIIIQVGSSVASDACESFWSGDINQQSGQVVVIPALAALVSSSYANLVTITVPLFTPQTFWWGAYNTNANNYGLVIGWCYD